MPFYESGLGECVTTAVNRGNLRFLHSDDMTEELAGIAVITAATPIMANGEVDSSQCAPPWSGSDGRNPGTWC